MELRERRKPGDHTTRPPGLGRITRWEGRLPKLPTGGTGANAQAAELAAHLGKLNEVLGGLGPLLDELAPGVIGTETVVLDGNGQAVRQFRVPFRSIAVDYWGAALLTVAAAPLAGAAPGPGPGVAKVGPGGFAVINVRAYQFSLYGNPGEQVTFTALAKPQPPNGVIAISPQVATLANVASSATSVPLFTPAPIANGRTIWNDSTAVLFVKFGATASATSYTVQIPAQGYFEFPVPVYAGEVDGIWAAANGAARLTSW